ncbi:hypothetical protein H310_13192 [Aphanomyces invadans]|uniref:FYVE-type domain-containing protein n=1 Tax=Aphanomyces invadans TaxID=157072 RepID=A0A024TEQ0_9STRA|nr:hypothetical protein H310_13192 [Aphanomyces invadans]ETV92508.1 hypothetical protein H310_13192 [Aphanomyces invadans]|eukprot:XP_008878815.1 hypothetical protein H310_13192 [Aphanomyces invadans]
MMMSEANVGRMLRNANERERILDPKQLLHHEKYTPFKSCTACHICTKSFGTFRRRAHCQLCGNVVCRSCTLDYIADVAGKIVDARVCSPCDGKLDVEFRQRTSSRAIAGTVLSRSFMSRPNPLATPSSSSSHVSRKKSPSRHRPESHPSSDIATESTPYFYALDFNWSHAWPKPPFIPHDVERIKSLSMLDVRRHDFMQSAVHFACEVFDTPIGGVSFIDEHQQWFASSRGLAQEFIPRQASICAHTIALAAPMAVLDLGQDIRFRHNPLVTGPNLGFYAGAPILSPDGHAVGTVFVMDLAPRSACDLSKLAVFAHVVSTKLADVRTDSASPTEASIASDSPTDRVISADLPWGLSSLPQSVFAVSAEAPLPRVRRSRV